MGLFRYIRLATYILIIALTLSSCVSSANNVPNGKIVYQSDQDGNIDLYIMDMDGSNQRNITKQSNDSSYPNNNKGPVASPDGMQIAFESDRDGNGEIYVIDITSEVQTNLTKNPANDYGPTWSPDGKFIAFLSDRDAILVNKERDFWTNNIYIMKADGSDVRRLTTDNVTYGYGNPAWSPDGKNIAICLMAISLYGFPYSAGIHTLALKDSSLTRITSGSLDVQCQPNWSPDGMRMLYTVFGSLYSEIYVMNSDGTGQAALSVDSSTLDIAPSWSPDGKYILFSSKRDGRYHIYIMNVDGTDLIQLTNGMNDETFPTWLPILDR